MELKQTELSNEKVIYILNDLLEKYPKGPRRKMKKSDYYTTRKYRPSTGHYGSVTVDAVRKPGMLFGYDISTLAKFAYAIDGNYRYVINAASGNSLLTAKSVSRRANRLQDRIEEIHSTFANSNVRSIYRVTFSDMYGYSYRSNWTNPTVMVVASNENAALLLGKTVAAGAGIVLKDEQINVRRVNVADKYIIEQVKLNCMKNITGSLSKLKKDAERIKSQIEHLVNFSVSLSSFNENT